MNGRLWVVSGALLAAAAVAAGAIGAHVLKEVLHLPDAQLQTYDVAVRYQMLHALATILIGTLVASGYGRSCRAAGCAFLLGTLLFSGGIYLWLLTDVKLFVQLVPVGGMAWIVGWLLLAQGAWVTPRGVKNRA